MAMIHCSCVQWSRTPSAEEPWCRNCERALRTTQFIASRLKRQLFPNSDGIAAGTDLYGPRSCRDNCSESIRRYKRSYPDEKVCGLCLWKLDGPQWPWE